MQHFNQRNIRSFTFLALIWFYSSCVNDDSNSSLTQNQTQIQPLFKELLPNQSGIHFSNNIEENFDHFFARFNYVYNGGGVAIGDVNNDNLPDIYFTGNVVPDKLYQNLGDLKFKDITNKALISNNSGWHNGVVMIDINNDGWLDVYVCRGGYEEEEALRKNLLYINQGIDKDNDGLVYFIESAASYGLDDPGYSIHASFFDMDNDGDLDLYITNRPGIFSLVPTQVSEGRKNPTDFNRDKLYRNDNNKFTEVGLVSGITNNFGYGLGLVTADFNKDGYTDIYVANDFVENDYLYINRGDGSFVESINTYTNHTPFYSMGVDAADINNDGWEDLIQLDMLPSDYKRSKTTMPSMNPQLYQDLERNKIHYQYMHNMLQLNRGRITPDSNNIFFSEIGQLSGISKTDWSWSCLGSDFDNDGWRDIFVTNGFRRDIWDKDAINKFNTHMASPMKRQKTNEENAQYLINLFEPNKINNYFFKNNKDYTFSDVSKDWGIHTSSFSNGAAVSDLDNDGDLDIVINNVSQQAFLYENKANESKRHFLRVRLRGSDKNAFGIGASVEIKYHGQSQYFQIKRVRGYLSSSEPIAHFGLGETQTVDSVIVTWPSGVLSVLVNPVIDTTIIIEENTGSLKKLEPGNLLQLFTFKPGLLQPQYVHVENFYDDYKDQILLPHKLSQQGPCISKGDINGDGLEDLFVGGAVGHPGQIYIQNNKGKLMVSYQPDLVNDSKYEDTGSIFYDADQDGDLDLYVCSGGNEIRDKANYQDRLYLNNNGQFTKSNKLPEFFESTSVVLPYDWDNDNDLDLFVGGRLTIAKYPKAPQSFLFENIDGHYKNVTKKLLPELSHIGMVTAGEWVDIDGDEASELILAGEWMPITIISIKKGKWANQTDQWNMSKSHGWWNCLKSDDVDHDGDIDLIAGNLGLNYKFSASEQAPFTVFADDFDDNGTNDVFLAKYYNGELVPIRGKECSSQQLPQINEQFKTYQDFAQSNIHEILNNKTNTALKYEAFEFASVWLENNNGKLLIHRLPMEAQFSSVDGIEIFDVNEDGWNDLIVCGNKFESEVETTRADAGIGQVFINQKDKSWLPISAERSGIFLPENAKDILGIYIQGKYHLISGINNGPLKSFEFNRLSFK